MSSVTKTVLIVVKQQGLDQVTTSLKGLDATSTKTTKSTNGLGTAWDKQKASTLNLRTGVTNLDKSEGKVVKTTGTLTKETDKAAKSTSGLAAKFQGNKGLIFSTVGIFTAGMEAVGMYQQLVNAQAKESEAQDRLNKLQQAGVTSGQDYTNAERDLADAKRGVAFASRIMALSFGDLIPFTLLLINSAFKLKETLGGAKTAVDAASQATTALGNATKGAATGGMAQIASSAGTATTGLTNMGNSSKLTNTAIGGLTTTATNFDRGLTTINTRVQDATRLIGNNNSGLTGGYYGLSTGIDNSTKTSSKFRDAFARIGDQIRTLPSHFSSVGSKIKDFFMNFGSNITHAGSAIKGFFTNFGTHIGKLPGVFKIAGTAVAGFGKALMGLALNPIGLAIIGVSSAVLALATDFGGVRTAINNAGVAVGNAIPPLKGILQAIGGAANGALDYVAGLMGVETGSEKAAKKAEALGKVLQDPLVVALKQVVKVGDELENLNTVVQKFDNVRTEIGKLSQGVASANSVFNTFSIAIADVNVETENAKAQVAAFNKATHLLGNSTLSAEEKQKLLTIALNAVSAALGEDVNQLRKDEQAKQQNTLAAQKQQAATLGVSQGVLASWSAYQKLTVEQGKGTQATDKNAQAVAQLAMKYGVELPDDINTATVQERIFIQSLYDNAPAFELIEGHIDITSGKAINLGDVLVSMAAQQVDNKTKALDLWESMKNGITSVGADAFPIIENALEWLKAVHPDIHAIVSEFYEDYKDQLRESGQFVEVLGTKESKRAEDNLTWQQKEVKALLEKRDELNEQAKALGIYDSIATKSNKTMEVAIKFNQDERKARDELTRTMQTLALQRGIEEKDLTVNIGKLKEYVQTHGLAPPTMEEVQVASANLTAARQADTKAAQLDQMATEDFLRSLGLVPVVSGQSAKSLMNVVSAYDTMKNATTIAADAVSDWMVDLGKARSVENATIEKLQELATEFGITIPDAIKQKGSPAMKEFLEKMMGVGEGAKKAAKEFADAWKEGVDKVIGSFETFGGRGTQRLSEVGQKLLDIAAKAREASDEFINGEGKRKERKEKFHETMMNLYDEETVAIGNMDIATAQNASAWQEWSNMATEAIDNMAASALMGNFPDAINQIETALDATPDQWKGASGQLEQILNGVGLETQDIAHLISANMEMVENAFTPVQVGAEYVGRAGAEAAAGLDELAAAALSTVNPMTDMDTAWKGFVGALSPAQKELGLVQAAIKAVESGSMTAAEGFQMLEGAGVKASEQIGSKVTRSLQDLEHQIINLGDGTETTVANINGQWINLGNSTASNLGTGGAQGNVIALENEMTNLGTTAQNELGSTVPGAMSTTSQTASTQFKQVVNYANLVTEVFKAVSVYADQYLNLGVKRALDGMVNNFTTLKDSISTEVDAMYNKISTFIMNTGNNINAFVDQILAFQDVITNLKNHVDTNFGTMDQKIVTFAGNTTKSLGGINVTATSTGTAFKTMGTTISSGSSVGLAGVTNFTGIAGKGLGGIIAQAGSTGKAFSSMGSQISNAMSSASNSVSKFASSASSAFSKVGSQAAQATKMVKQLQSAINSLKSKSINVHVGLTGPGARFYRHGGAFISADPTGFAQSGASFINTKPRKIGGMNISEFGKPELVTVTPLSDPGNPMDKSINMGLPDSKLQPIPQMTSGLRTGGTGGGQQQQPITVTGNMDVSVMLPDGSVIAKAVKPFLLSGFSGIT